MDNYEQLLVVLEVSRDRHEVALFYRVVLGLPNREHKLSRVWVTSGGHLAAPQLADMLAWIGEQVSQAVFDPHAVARRGSVTREP